MKYIKKWLTISAVILSGHQLLAGCSDRGAAARFVHLTVANYTSLGQLADSSEYLIRGTVSSSPQRTVLDRDTGLAYMVSEVKILEIFGQRPDVLEHLASDKTIRVGVSVLDPQEKKNIINFDELSTTLPTADDALTKGEDVLLFLSRTEHLKDLDYEVIGYGVINPLDQVKWNGFPGELADTTSDLVTATQSDIISKYSSSSRSQKPDPGIVFPEPPPEGRPPVSALDSQQDVGSMDGSAAYDESIPETSLQPYWVAHDDLKSLSRSSDIAFVGRITDYNEAVLVVHDDPTEEPDPTATVYDGVVFIVDEVLVGKLPAGETQVTIATPVLFRNPDGTNRFRVSVSPIEIVRPGIFARDEPERQSYIVYALAGHKGTPFHVAGVYFFNTPGGVAPILANDRIGRGADRPLAGTLEEAGDEGAIATDGEVTSTPAVGPSPGLADSGLGLDDARTAARTATLAID